MDHHDQHERRAFPRFNSTLPLTFTGKDIEITASTKNISCSGVYCETTQFVPVMTKLSITLSVPLIVNERKQQHRISCAAVVVRVEPEQEQHIRTVYRLGCFFPDISVRHREVIAQYIQQAFFAGRN